MFQNRISICFAIIVLAIIIGGCLLSGANPDNPIGISKPGIAANNVIIPSQPQMAAFSDGIFPASPVVARPISPIQINDSTLQSALRKYPLLVLESYADWCEFCKKMNGTISMLSADLMGQVAFGLIDAEKNPGLENKYNITAYPTLLIFRNGVLVDTETGYKRESDFALLLKRVEPSLDISHVNLTTIIPTSVIPSMPNREQVVIGSNPGTDAELRYLDRILNLTKYNHTSGITINVFIINCCPKP